MKDTTINLLFNYVVTLTLLISKLFGELDRERSRSIQLCTELYQNNIHFFSSADCFTLNTQIWCPDMMDNFNVQV